MSEVMRKKGVVEEGLEHRLFESIEALVDGRITHSSGATTDRGTVHRVFRNGVRVLEGAVVPHEAKPVSADNGFKAYCEAIQDIEARTILAIRAYRDEIKGPANLVWRVKPELRDGSVYVRLSFEPSLRQVAPGIWIEERLLDG